MLGGDGGDGATDGGGGIHSRVPIIPALVAGKRAAKFKY
jgi:hypothetical protein